MRLTTSAVHDALWWLTDPSNPSSSLPTSVIGLIIITVPATITAVAYLIAKLPRGVRPQDDPPAPLPLPTNPPEPNPAQAVIDHKRRLALERWCYLNGFDPEKIKRGTEAIDSVRITT